MIGTASTARVRSVAPSKSTPSNGLSSADPSKYSKRRKRRDALRLQKSLSYLALALTLVASFVYISNRIFSNTLQRKHLTFRRAQQLHSQLAHLPHFQGGQETDTSAKTRRLEADFAQARLGPPNDSLYSILDAWLTTQDQDIQHNIKGGIRWIRPYLLPPLTKTDLQDDTEALGFGKTTNKRRRMAKKDTALFLKQSRSKTIMKWEQEWEATLQQTQQTQGPIVDYTDPTKYTYPTLPKEGTPLPLPPNQYPPLKPLQQLMNTWPQDQDYPGAIREQLLHFNYSNPSERNMAQVLRDHEIPFKLYDIPEFTEASKKWTDDYVAFGFGRRKDLRSPPLATWDTTMPSANGVAQESPNNYFAFFTPQPWNIEQMGLPPTRNNDWTFGKWAQHARYADATRLSFDQPHFYWQAGVDREERYKDSNKWSFISRDLPSFSSAEENFFVFHPEEQKGIQCRFGERGVVAATHYDGGRNFVGMITGAKRYILSPPNQCGKLGVFTSRKSPIYRHSLLNFAHISHLTDGKESGMSQEERAWLERAGRALSVETVLKAGEALYIPSHWFHYIISLQKSAQCNVRSGINKKGNPDFGNRETVEKCRLE